jgi:twinkle protein
VFEKITKEGKDFYIFDRWSDLGVAEGTGRASALCPICSSSRKPENRNQKCLSINFDHKNAECNNEGEIFILRDDAYKKEERHEKKKNYQKPKEKPKLDIPDNILSYLYSRKLSQKVIRRNQLGHSVKWFAKAKIEAPCISFPYYKDGEHVGTKYRLPNPKDHTAETNTEPIVYGYDDIKGGTLFWVEGEFDKLAVEVAGFENCVSVPNGAKSAGCLDNIKEKLKGVKHHIIAVDNDKDGNQLESELIRRLNPAKCKTVKFTEGCKDANGVLIAHGPDALRQCLMDQTPVPIDGVIKPSAIISKLKELYYNEQEEGLSTGWCNLDKLYRVAPGQWTVVTGIPNHGKSEWLDSLMTNMIIKHKWKFGIFSPENHPVQVHMRKILKKIVKKPYGKGYKGSMPWSVAEECTINADDFITFVGDREEGHTVESILEITESLILSEGINGMIIDPWNAIGHSMPGNTPETQYLEKKLTDISRIVRKYGIHIWVVAHPTKLQKRANNTYAPPLPYDIAGSANWYNKPDNAITVYIPTGDDVHETEVWLLVNKIKFRENGRPGETKLFFNQALGTYHLSADLQ